MPRRCILISINTSWNIVNFRAGLVRALLERGFEVVAAAPLDDYSVRLTEMGCRFVPLEIDNKGADPRRDMVLLARYVALLRRERPVAFLGYTIKPNIYGSLAAHSLAIPVINNISGLGTVFIGTGWVTPIVRGLYRAALSRSHTVFFQNEEDRSLFTEMKIVKRERSCVLPGSGIDLMKFAPQFTPPSKRPRSVRFLLIGRLLRDKGVMEYVEAARMVRARMPDATFGLLGFLDVENRTAIDRATVDAWEAEGVVEYLGATDDVRPHISAADCVVLPSYREGTPRTLLEAAAMGKPLIATDVPGCREVVEDGVNGYLCRARDAADLAQKFEAYAALDAAERQQMGAASRSKVEAEFDERLVIKRYLWALEAIPRP